MERIKLFNEFGKNIFTRSTISDFFANLNSIESEKIILDFKDIDFVSRSCVDEYLKQREKSSKKITEKNISEKVYKMFKNVEKQYEKEGVSISFHIGPNDKRLVSA